MYPGASWRKAAIPAARPRAGQAVPAAAAARPGAIKARLSRGRERQD